MAGEYQYMKLIGTNSIRLLSLQPGRAKDPISITLRECDLSAAWENYDALSYEWGRSGKISSVTCEKGKIAITKNLMLALRQLRHTRSCRILWIDAICINQADSAERSQQVAHMKQIYAGANQVLVWLGLEQSRSVDVFDMIETLAKKWLRHDCARSKRGEIFTMPWYDPDPADIPELAMNDSELWNALYGLLNHSYFSRVWIVQEIALARKPPRIICGNINRSWLWFSWAAMYVGCSRYHLDRCLPKRGVARIHLISHLHSTHKTGHTIDFRQLYDVSRSSEATDGRDKVYGLLGLRQHEAAHSSSLQSNFFLEINYGLDAADVYRNAAAMAILESQNLDFLHANSFARRTLNNLPSWVPDWSASATEGFPCPLSNHQYLHSRRTKNITIESGVLCVSGSLVEKITYVTSVLSCDDPLPSIEKIMFDLTDVNAPADSSAGRCNRYLFQALDKVVQILRGGRYHDVESTYEALWRTLVANTVFFMPAPDSFQRHFNAIIDTIRIRALGITASNNLTDVKSLMHLLVNPEAQFLYERIAENDSKPFFHEMTMSIAERVFFKTSGGFMGIGSPGVAVGDHVAILEGGTFPFLLRDEGDGFFAMVGDAYVHRLEEIMLKTAQMTYKQNIAIR